jgi:hypothetical protein
MNLFFFYFLKTDWRKLLKIEETKVPHAASIWINVLALFFISLNFTHVHHSLELRAYGTLSLVALLCFHLIHRIWNRPFQWRNVLYTSLLLNTHVYAAIMVAISSLYTVTAHALNPQRENQAPARGDISRKSRILITTLLIALIYILPIWLSFCHSSLPRGHAVSETHMSIERGAGGIKQVYKFYYHNKPIQHASHFFFAAGTLMMLKTAPISIIFVYVMVFLPTLLIYLMDLFGRYWFLQKQFIWVITFWAVYLAYCYHATFQALASVLRKFRRA